MTAAQLEVAYYLVRATDLHERPEGCGPKSSLTACDSRWLAGSQLHCLLCRVLMTRAQDYVVLDPCRRAQAEMENGCPDLGTGIGPQNCLMEIDVLLKRSLLGKIRLQLATVLKLQSHH